LQALYNKPDNWVERNRIGLEKVRKQLQDLIDSVKQLQDLLIDPVLVPHFTGFRLILTHYDGDGPIVILSTTQNVEEGLTIIIFLMLVRMNIRLKCLLLSIIL
jgi:hypothetical protein